jgi:hypothetical protein
MAERDTERMREALEEVTRLLRAERNSLVESSTLPIGDMSTLDELTRPAVEELDAALSAADAALAAPTEGDGAGEDAYTAQRAAELAARGALRMVAKVLRDTAGDTRAEPDPRAAAVADGLIGVAEAIEEDLEKFVGDIVNSGGLKIALAETARASLSPPVDVGLKRALSGPRPGWATDADVLLSYVNGRDGYYFESGGMVDVGVAREAINLALGTRAQVIPAVDVEGLVERATELLAQGFEAQGNKAAAFTLRNGGPVGTAFEAAHGAVLHALSALHQQPARTEGEEPIAWRWRHMYPDQENRGWRIRQTPIYPCAPSVTDVGIEVQPLYAHPAALSQPQGMQKALEEAARALLGRVDRHVYEIAEPLFLEEREALRAALASSTGNKDG